MKLSILIPSIPERFDKAQALYEMIDSQSIEEVEVLLLMDNKKRTIGEKRNNIKDLAQGKYFTIIDDDDQISDDYVEEVLKAMESSPDVITYKQRCFNPNGAEFIVTFGLGNEVEHNCKDDKYLDIKRPAWHNCVWLTEKFQKIIFPHMNYGEDGIWAERATLIAKTEIHIDKILHQYNFDAELSAATLD